MIFIASAYSSCFFLSVFSLTAVLNELDGLCRSRLEAAARAALSFLRADQKNPQIRYVTSKGAPLPAMACTMNEENDDQV